MFGSVEPTPPNYQISSKYCLFLADLGVVQSPSPYDLQLPVPAPADMWEAHFMAPGL